MNDATHLKLIDFLGRSVDILFTGLDSAKLRKVSRSQSFQVALIARIHDRSDSVLTLLREDRDHSIGELVRSIHEAHASLVFLKKEKKARFRLEIESAEESIRLLRRLLTSPQLSIEMAKEANQILKAKEKRKKLLFSRGIRKATKADRMGFLDPVAKDIYGLLSSESHHDLLSLFDSHLDTSNGIVEFHGGRRRSDRTLIIYVAVILQAVHAAMKIVSGNLSKASYKQFWKDHVRQHTNLIVEVDRWGQSIVNA